MISMSSKRIGTTEITPQESITIPIDRSPTTSPLPRHPSLEWEVDSRRLLDLAQRQDKDLEQEDKDLLTDTLSHLRTILIDQLRNNTHNILPSPDKEKHMVMMKDRPL